jgi:hypothetical protein
MTTKTFILTALAVALGVIVAVVLLRATAGHSICFPKGLC